MAEEGSFLLQLRCDRLWDRVAFTRLTEAMLACCWAYDNGSQRPTLLGRVDDPSYLPRWLAEGFWCVATFVEGHTAHPAWKEKIAADPVYYDQAYQCLRDLADWFFTGQCGYLDPGQPLRLDVTTQLRSPHARPCRSRGRFSNCPHGLVIKRQGGERAV